MKDIAAVNVTEKILARASGRESVSPGDVIFADVDKAMVHDVSGPGVMKVFERISGQGVDTKKLWDPSKVWIAEDHFVPSADKISAGNIIKLQDFARNYGIRRHFKYGMGQYGICHTLSHEEALVLPGEVYVGGDSHTNTTGALGAFACGLGHTDMAYVLLYGKIWFKVPETVLLRLNGALPPHVMAKDYILRIIGDMGTDGGAYRTMQFAGTGITEMSVEGRLTLANMTTEAGAKNGIIEADKKTAGYLSSRGATGIKPVIGDDDAEYSEVFEYEGSEMEPLVAKPYSPENVSIVREAPSVELDKAYIGSCTGAKMEDLEAAARILKGRKVRIRTEVLPAAISIYRKAVERGLVGIFLDAGATVGPPTCGACCGAHMGVLGKGEVCISTTNRNFPGRMGDIESQTYLASPLVAAASAVTGKITDPRDLN
ncbi:3-isopropylmalate dehydratase large subunit [Cenarchaeum symbiosum A]|uniref:3-isopropylmalate dehydratase large subunit n=1 Tax=Cenarchaeum symbiosum (strain A) TaxID=414004 RepID=A0RXN9_CENSY|nr:3-isopropylmalate dehydratase large subunit [Cenarchaeum symbiosum A]